MTRSPFRRDHAASAQFRALALSVSARVHDRVLHGERTFGWPVMALRTSFALGPVRHALSQRTVAGTMTVFPPILARPSAPAEGPDDASET